MRLYNYSDNEDVEYNYLFVSLNDVSLLSIVNITDS